MKRCQGCSRLTLDTSFACSLCWHKLSQPERQQVYQTMRRCRWNLITADQLAEFTERVIEEVQWRSGKSCTSEAG